MTFRFDGTATAIALALAMGGMAPAVATAQSAPAVYSQTIEGLTRQDGLLTLFTDPASGKVLLQLPPAAEDGPLPEMFASVYISLRQGRADLAAKALERCRRLSSPDLFGYVMGDPAFASLRGWALPGAM